MPSSLDVGSRDQFINHHVGKFINALTNTDGRAIFRLTRISVDTYELVYEATAFPSTGPVLDKQDESKVVEGKKDAKGALKGA